MASRASSGDAKTELAQQLTRKLLDQQQIVAVYAQQLALCEPGSAQYKEVKRNHEEASMLLEALTLNLQSVMMTLNEKLHCSPAPLATADARPPPAAKSSSSSPDLPLGAYPSPTPPLRKASMLSSVLSPASKRRADTPQKALPVAPTSSRGTTPTPAASAASTAAPPVVAPLPPYQPSPSPSTRTATPGGTRKPLPRTPTQPPAAMPAPTPATDTIAIPPKHDGHLAASPTSVSLMSAAAKLGSLRSAASSDVADADAAATDADRSSSSSSSSSSLSRDVSPSPDAASPERSASHSRNATPSFVQRPLVQASPSLRRAKATASEPTSLSRPYDAGSAPSTPTRRKAPIDPSLAAAQRVVRVGDGTSPERHDAPTHHDDEEHAADGASTPSSSSSRSRNATVLVHDREALMIEKPVISETEVMILPPTPEQLEAQEEMLRKWERMQKKIETAEQFGLEMPEIEVEKPEQPQSGLSKVTNTIVEALVGSEQHRNTRIRDEADDEKSALGMKKKYLCICCDCEDFDPSPPPRPEKCRNCKHDFNAHQLAQVEALETKSATKLLKDCVKAQLSFIL